MDGSLAARGARLRRVKSVENLRSLIYEPGPSERYTQWDALSLPNTWLSFRRTTYSRHGDQALLEVVDNRSLVQKDAEHRSSCSQHKHFDSREEKVWHDYLPESSRSAAARCSDPISHRLTTSSRFADRKPEDFKPEIPASNTNSKPGRCDDPKLRRRPSPQHPLRPNAKSQPNDTQKTKPARPSIIDATHAEESRIFQWRAKKPIRLILHELNIPLSSVTLRTSDIGETMEFNEEVTRQLKYSILYDRWPKGDKNDPYVGFFRGVKKPCDISSQENKANNILQRMDSRLPFRRPDLQLITIRSDSDRDNVDDPNNVKLHIPQAIVYNEDVSCRDDGRLVIKGDASRVLLSNSILWLPRGNPVLVDFNLLRSLPTSSSQLITDENGSVDILKTHLVHGRWTWLTESVEKRNIDGKIDGRELQIDVDRTSEFDDARMMLLRNHPKDQPLKDFCNGKPVSYRDMPDNTGFKRMMYRLRPLIHESHVAAAHETSRYLSDSEQNLKELWKVDYFVGENTRLAAAIKETVKNRDIVEQADLKLRQKFIIKISSVPKRKTGQPWEMFQGQKLSLEPPWWWENWWENIIDVDPESASNWERRRGWRRGVFGQYEDARCDPEKHKVFYSDRTESPFRQLNKDQVGKMLLKDMAEAGPPRGSHLASVHFDHSSMWSGRTSKYLKHSYILGLSIPWKSRFFQPEEKGKKKDTSIHPQEWDRADRAWLLRNFAKQCRGEMPPELIPAWCLTCERELPWNDGHVPACSHQGMDAKTLHMPVKEHVTVVRKSNTNRVQPVKGEQPVQNAPDVAPEPVLKPPSAVPSAAPSLNPITHDHEELVRSGPEVAANPAFQPSVSVQSLSPTFHDHDFGAELQRTLCRALNENRTVAEFGYYPMDLSALPPTGSGSQYSPGALMEENALFESNVPSRESKGESTTGSTTPPSPISTTVRLATKPMDSKGSFLRCPNSNFEGHKQRYNNFKEREAQDRAANIGECLALETAKIGEPGITIPSTESTENALASTFIPNNAIVLSQGPITLRVAQAEQRGSAADLDRVVEKLPVSLDPSGHDRNESGESKRSKMTLNSLATSDSGYVSQRPRESSAKSEEAKMESQSQGFVSEY